MVRDARSDGRSHQFSQGSDRCGRDDLCSNNRVVRNRNRQVEPGRKKTSIFITPGYQFQCIDAILTNFHMPRTTMLAMLSAFVQQNYLFQAYEEAVREKYRFLSFGDSMLIA